jgi:hypothetical protein
VAMGLRLGQMVSPCGYWIKIGTDGESLWLLTRAHVELFILAYIMKLHKACDE